MKDFVCIGKIVNTHGIRGELRLLSKFPYKKKAFAIGREIYIGKNKQREVITGYRVHKCFDMITLDGYSNINEVLPFKGMLCYVLRSDLHLNNQEYLDEDLIGLPYFVDGVELGKVLKVEVLTPQNKILWVSYQNREVAVPFVSEFVNVLLNDQKIEIQPIAGMFDEN